MCDKRAKAPPQLVYTQRTITMASNRPSASQSSSGGDSDQEFDPSADMMANDFDDEGTLEEEEALNEDDDGGELDDLQRDAEMPIEQLLAMYGYGGGGDHDNELQESDGEPSSSTSTSPVVGPTHPASEPSVSTADKTSTQGIITSTGIKVDSESLVLQSSSNSVSTSASGVSASVTDANVGLPAQQDTVDSSLSLFNVSDDDDDDDDYSEDDDIDDIDFDDLRKTIHVGENYQAQVPEACEPDYADSNIPYEEEDVIVWDPYRLPEELVKDYLSQIRDERLSRDKKSLPEECGPSGISSLEHSESKSATDTSSSDPTVAADVTSFVDTLTASTGHVFKPPHQDQDDEEALFLLVRCNYSVADALERFKKEHRKELQLSRPPALWTDDEILKFEDGLRIFGKDFFIIHQNRVPTKSVPDLVTFYYLWKKTERYDVFIRSCKLERRRYDVDPITGEYIFGEQDDIATSALNALHATLGYPLSQSGSSSSSSSDMSSSSGSSSSNQAIGPMPACLNSTNASSSTSHRYMQSHLTESTSVSDSNGHALLSSSSISHSQTADPHPKKNFDELRVHANDSKLKNYSDRPANGIDSVGDSITSSCLDSSEEKRLLINGQQNHLNEVSSSSSSNSMTAQLVNGVNTHFNHAASGDAIHEGGGDTSRTPGHNEPAKASHSGPMKGNSLNAPQRHHPYGIINHMTHVSAASHHSAPSIHVAAISSSTTSHSSSHHVASNGSIE